MWQQFIDAYDFNNTYHLRPDIKLTKSHVYPSQTDKVHNHLAEEVLNKDFLDLMIKYQQTVEMPHKLESTVKLLGITSKIVDIFTNIHSAIESLEDLRVKEIVKIIEFFDQWESQFSDEKQRERHMMTKETWDDVFCSLIGFLEVLKISIDNSIAIIPGYFNSDLIENWFCQLRGLRQGMSTNMTLSQVGPAINANLLTSNLISNKSNSGGLTRSYNAAEPAPKKIKKQ